MASTVITDVVTPEIYDEYMQENWYAKSALWRSSIIVESANFNSLLDGGATSFNFPFWKVNDLQSDTANAVNQGDTLTPNNITAGKQIARRLFFENAWGKNDLVEVAAGSDPLEAVLNTLANYWAKTYQDALFAVVRGVIADNIANDSGDLVSDITSNTTKTINENDVITAMQKQGDQMMDFTAIAMHSKPYSDLLARNLVKFYSGGGNTPLNEADIGWGTYLGKTVIVDDALISGSTYWNIIFKRDSFMSGFSNAGYVPAETDRDPSKSGGETIVYSRRVMGIHPHGFAWTEGSIAGTYPTIAELASGAHWNRVAASVKNTGFVVLKTK